MRTVMTPFVEFARGLSAYWRGVDWLRRHPRYLCALFVPLVLALVATVTGWVYLFSYDDWLIGKILFDKPLQDPLWISIYYVARFFIYVSFVLVGLVLFILLANVVASPIYEWVSVAIERDLYPGTVQELSFWKSIKLIGEELKKVLFIISVSLVLILIPGLNLLATFLTAFLIGWEFYDYPLARRGLRFRERFRFVIGDFWAVMGFGLWLMIPFVQILLMPMAVAGGTILNLERLEKISA